MVEERAARRRAVVAAAAVVLAAIAAVSPALAQTLSDAEVLEVLGRAKLGASRVGVSVVDLSGGRELVAIRKDEAFIPASNMKLLTSGTAAAVLGPEFEFRTTLWQSGDRLIVEGSGDPAFADPALLDEMGQDVDAFLDRLAEAVKSGWDMGAGPIREVVVDDRVLDREYVHPTWPADQLRLWYCAEVGGLNFFANVVRLYARPGEQEGMSPSVRLEPSAPWLAVENRARTAKKNESTTLDLSRVGQNNTFVLRGAIRSALVRPIEATTHESSLLFARLLADRLGTAVGRGGTPAWRLAGAEEDLGDAGARRALAVVRTPLSVVLARCNMDSHNLYAEALIKRVGHEVTRQPGSWANGAAVVRMQLRERVGPEAAAAVSVADGSGLSRGNLITPGVMTAWLGALSRDTRVAPVFIASIPEAGVEGNMAKRFRGRELTNEVRCKSGYINGVRTLSGYVINRETGRMAAFSILVNDTPGNVPGARVREFHEDVVELVDKWMTGVVKKEMARGVGAGAAR